MKQTKGIFNKLYYDNYYNNDFNFMVYYKQIQLIKRLGDKVRTILEIGCGSKVVSNLLINMGYDIKTLDIVKELKPDFEGSIVNLLDIIKDSKFDLVIITGTIEYCQLNEIESIFKQINKCSKYLLLFNLRAGANFTFMYRLPLFNRRYINIRLPFISKKSEEYVWEIENGISLSDYDKILTTYFKVLEKELCEFYPRVICYLLESEFSEN